MCTKCQRARIGIAACLRNRCLRVRISPLSPIFIVEIRAGRAAAAHPARFQLIHGVCSNVRMNSMTDSDQPSMCVHLP